MLLETKLMKPCLPARLIEREAVLCRLDPALEQVLTLVSAPPGYGKTTLVAQWLERRQLPHAWLTLDRHDDNPAAFWRALCAALGRHEARLFERVWPRFSPLAETTVETSVESGMQALVRELLDYSRTWKSPRRLVLVLDDFHSISDPELLRQISQFLDYCPDLLRCVLTSRSDPALDLPRRRVRHQLLELRSDTLRFDLAAADRFLSQRMGVTLPLDNLRLLLERTEGWVAALQLAGMSLAAQPERLRELCAFSGRQQRLSDYLLSEVFVHLPASLQVFLREIAIAPRFSATFCDAVLGRDDSAERLAQILTGNLLVQALDESGSWYRLHDLFRDWLLQQPPAADRQQQLRERAAAWYAGQDLWLEALEQWLDLQDWQRASEVVAASLESWLHEGNLVQVEPLLARFPGRWVQHNPWLGLLHCLQRLNRGDYVGAATTLDAVEQRLQAGPPWSPESLLAANPTGFVDAAQIAPTAVLKAHAFVRIMRSNLARFGGDLETASRLAREAEPRHLQDAAFNAWVLQGIGADHYVKGDLRQASEFLVRAVTLAESHRDRSCQLYSLFWLVPTLLHRGELNLAWSWTERVQADLGSHWREHPLAACLPFFRASLLRERNRLDAAGQELAEAYALGGVNQPAVNRIFFGFLRWHLALSRRDFAEADTALEELEFLYNVQGTPWSYVMPDVATMRALTRTLAGDPGALLRWAQKVDLQRPAPPMRKWVERLLWVRAQWLQRQPLEPELQRLRDEAEHGGIRLRVLQTWLLEAMAEAAQGRLGEATAALSQALQISAVCGFTRVYLDEGASLPVLLQACLGKPLVAAEARRILDEFGHQPQPVDVVGKAAGSASASATTESLSGRELEVLRLLNSGLSNQDLAAALGISPATVKTHLRNIFGKLGVRNRTQALAQARQRALLG